MRVARRIRELTWLINHSRQVQTAWSRERGYLERTGRLDWVDPYPIRVRPAGSVMKPPPPRPRN